MASPGSKPNVRNDLKQFSDSEFQCDFGKLNSTQRSLALLKFYVIHILNFKDLYIDEDELEEGITDGGNDINIDFVYKNDGVVTFIQVKYLSPNGPIKEDDITRFQSTFYRVFDPNISKNKKISDAIGMIDFKRDNFHMIFVGLGKLDNNALAAANVVPRQPDIYDDFADRITWEYFDESGLNEEYRIALSTTEGVQGCYEFTTSGSRGSRSGIIELNHHEFPSYVLVVDAKQIIQLYQQFKDRLFSLNIRNYIGDTATNKGIIDSAINSQDEFFHYNNGVSCLAKAVEADFYNGKLKTTALQIINGAQTVKSIYRAYSRLPEERKAVFDLSVLMRVTVLEKGYGKFRKFREEIVKNNNCQNKIKASDFRSNDSIQNDLVSKFSKIKINGQPVEYVNKRTDIRKKKDSKIIRMEEFAKAVYSFLCDPISFSGSVSYLFDIDRSGGYSKVFGDGSEPYNKMPEAEFKLRAAIWWIAESFMSKLKVDRKKLVKPEERQALERKWILIYTSRLILERIYGGDDYRDSVSKLYKGQWIGTGNKQEEWIDRIYTAAKNSVLYVYSEDYEKNKEEFNHRNWMRSSETPKKLYRFASKAPGLDDIPKLEEMR